MLLRSMSTIAIEPDAHGGCIGAMGGRSGMLSRLAGEVALGVSVVGEVDMKSGTGEVMCPDWDDGADKARS